MRAMRTYAKKKEHANAPIGPFTTFSHRACGYNIRNELISAAKNTEHQYQYDELDSLASDGGVAYAYDAAGNRTTQPENGETITYTLGLRDGLASWISKGSSSMGSDPMDVLFYNRDIYFRHWPPNNGNNCPRNFGNQK